jgi:TorA maturation chaperone TorD
MGTSFDQAMLRSAAYDILSQAFLYPAEDTAGALARKMENLAAGARVLPWPAVAAAATAAAGGLRRVDADGMRDAFLAIFGHTVPADCPPYGAEYGQAHIFQKSQAMADVAAFYQAFGVRPNVGLKDRPDHLSVEMAFMHLLALKEAYALSEGGGAEAAAVCRQGQEAFLARQLAPWTKVFAARATRKAGPDNPYLLLLGFLDAFMDEEFAAFHLTPATERTAGRGIKGLDNAEPVAHPTAGARE